MTLSKQRREQVRMMFGGHCAYCGVVLTAKWHADHVEPLHRKIDYHIHPVTRQYVGKATGESWNPQNDREDNFFPACIACNINKSCTPLEVWRGYLEALVTSLARNNASYRHAVRFGMVQTAKTKVTFFFETWRKHHERD